MGSGYPPQISPQGNPLFFCGDLHQCLQRKELQKSSDFKAPKFCLQFDRLLPSTLVWCVVIRG